MSLSALLVRFSDVALGGLDTVGKMAGAIVAALVPVLIVVVDMVII